MNRTIRRTAAVGVLAVAGIAGAAPVLAAKTPVLRVDVAKGKLAFTQKKLVVAKPGKVTFVLHNASGVPHNLGVKGNGLDDEQIGAPTKTITKGAASATYSLKKGTYEFYCEVPGHEAAGMKGVLIVK